MKNFSLDTRELRSAIKNSIVSELGKKLLVLSEKYGCDVSIERKYGSTYRDTSGYIGFLNFYNVFILFNENIHIFDIQHDEYFTEDEFLEKVENFLIKLYREKEVEELNQMRESIQVETKRSRRM